MKNRKAPVMVLLGPAGSFSDQAGRRFEHLYEKKYVASFKQLFEKVRSGSYGLAPVQNKIIGPILKSERLWNPHMGDFIILRRFIMKVSFVLAAKKKIELNEIRKVFCIPVVLAQCGEFIRKFLPNAHMRISGDSSSALFKKVAQLGEKMASVSVIIGPEKAAKIYGFTVIRRKIENDPKDWTEFVLFKKNDSLRVQKKSQKARSQRSR